MLCTERPNELAKQAPLPQVYPTHQFTYDRVFGPNSQQAEVYEHAARGAVLSTLQVLALNTGTWQWCGECLRMPL